MPRSRKAHSLSESRAQKCRPTSAPIGAIHDLTRINSNVSSDASGGAGTMFSGPTHATENVNAVMYQRHRATVKRLGERSRMAFSISLAVILASSAATLLPITEVSLIILVTIQVATLIVSGVYLRHIDRLHAASHAEVMTDINA